MIPFILVFMIVGEFFGGADGDGGSTAGLRSAVFLQQPERVRVNNESETATFRCSVVNSTFSIIWLVNGSDASYEEFEERGVSIVHDPNDGTRSRLEVPGHACNNNTEVHCAALRGHSDPQLRWIESERVLLLVQGLSQPTEDKYAAEEGLGLRATTHRWSTAEAVPHTPLPTYTEVVVVQQSSAEHRESSYAASTTTPHLLSLPEQGKLEKQRKKTVMFWSLGGGAVGLGLLVVVVAVSILLTIRKHRGTGKTSAEEANEEMESNPTYDSTHRIQLQQNEVYQMVKPTTWQNNCAYHTVVIRNS